MKCITCIYFPCIRLECAADSNCEHYRSIVEAELIGIDNRALIDPVKVIYSPKKH